MNCREIQDRLAEDFDAASTLPEIKTHLEGCPDCRRILDRLREVDQALADLSQAEPPTKLVQRTVEAVEKQARRPKGPARLALAIAAPVVLVLVVGVVSLTMLQQAEHAGDILGDDYTDASTENAFARYAPPTAGENRRVYALGPRTRENTRGDEGGRSGLELNGQRPATDGLFWDLHGMQGGKDLLIVDDSGVSTVAGDLGVLEKKVDELKERVYRSKARLNLMVETEGEEETDLPNTVGPVSSSDHSKNMEATGEDRRQVTKAGGEKQWGDQTVSEGWHVSGKEGKHGGEGKVGRDFGEGTEKDEKDEKEQGLRQAGQGYLKVESRTKGAQVYLDGKRLDFDMEQPIRLAEGRHRVTVSRPGHQDFETTVRIRRGETQKLNVRPVSLEELTFIPAQGYFANTYLPGDPELEWLKSELAQGIFLDGQLLSLESGAVPYRQPFDAPATDGLAVYMASDLAYLEGDRGPARVTIQVGLKGSERHARRRAALNAALVVDLRQTPPEESRRILWALADALESDQQAGDRFWLVVAGAKVPVVLQPKEFTPGAARLSLARALQALESSRQRKSLYDALEAACQVVSGDGVGEAPLGANLVLLASAAPLTGEAERLQTLAHQYAVQGISLSTIGVGAQADRSALGALALAGQGRRRLVADLKPAAQVIEDELSASGRVVARAVRLRIRLSEGVKLVEVLGSHPLDVVRTQRVRQAEKAIDQRVARTLGVDADRGDDEDGIQIVIPAYYAGDSHVILLDVVAPGPGKIADVRVRYKDLVNLKNAVARASLNLPAGRRPKDLLVQNVKKNLLAHRISDDLLQAGRQLSQGKQSQAVAALTRAAARIDMLRKDVPALTDDSELKRDAEMLAEYLQVLGDYPMWQNNQELRTRLARSLVYAGKVKLPPGAGLVARR